MPPKRQGPKARAKAAATGPNPGAQHEEASKKAPEALQEDFQRLNPGDLGFAMNRCKARFTK